MEGGGGRDSMKEDEGKGERAERWEEKWRRRRRKGAKGRQ